MLTIEVIADLNIRYNFNARTREIAGDAEWGLRSTTVLAQLE
jgi:hypothetical protein